MGEKTMRTTPPALALRQARSHLLEHGDFSQDAIDERIARSWRRSMAAGLQPTGRLPEPEHASGGILRNALTLNQDLVAHSRPVMEFLFEQVRHSQSMVILADKRGTLVHTLGDASFLNKAERVALASGASWHEQQRGTNAIGTALAEASCIEVHGSEHFLERNGFLTCAAAPIISATGELLGVLDISGDQRSRHPHTLGLVNTAARMIENRLITHTCRHHIRLHLHGQPEGIGTIAEGIIALSEDGWIVGANRLGMGLLGLTVADIGSTPIFRVLDVALDKILSQVTRHPQQSILLHRHDGVPLYALVHGDRSVAVQTQRPDAKAAIDALTKLDTGDARWRAAADKARRIIGKHIPLLLNGESGVGKEMFARALHEISPYKEGPFIAINCAALPENLIEAELFGYSQGAFTGARKEGSIGRLREAEGGTLFLDEIGDMPLNLQTRLLRVLEARQVTPLGGGQSVNINFALVCATHQNLREASAKGSFRSDLYYRINGLTLQLPALRERSDFAKLTHKLLLDLTGDANIHLAPELLPQLAAYHWPGNLRQYASALRTAVAMLNIAETRIDLTHLPDEIFDGVEPAERKAVPTATPRQRLAEISLLAIQQALENTHGNYSAAARQLGISRQTLYRKLK
jgi:transcriptional regulator of acetoin/glycerol metabolism